MEVALFNEQSNLIDWINDDDDDDEIKFIIPYCSRAQTNASFFMVPACFLITS